MEKVTIVVPVYNAEKYLDDCIQSVLKQDYQDFCLLIINDGSTDHSQEILKKWALKDKRIRVINRENKGIHPTLREGVLASDTPYTMFLDSDDTYKVKMVSTLVNAIERLDVDCVMGGYVKKENYKEFVPLKVKNKRFNKQEIYDYILYEFYEKTGNIYKNWGSARWDKIYKTNVLKIAITKYDANLKMGGDLLFNLQVLYCAQNVATIDDAYNYEYRVLSESVSRGFSEKKYVNSENLVQAVNQFGVSIGMECKAIGMFKDNCWLNMLYEIDTSIDKKTNKTYRKRILSEIVDKKKVLKQNLSLRFPNLAKIYKGIIR